MQWRKETKGQNDLPSSAGLLLLELTTTAAPALSLAILRAICKVIVVSEMVNEW